MATSTKNFWAGLFGIIFHMELLGEERGKFMMLTTQLARAFKIFPRKLWRAAALSGPASVVDE